MKSYDAVVFTCPHCGLEMIRTKNTPPDFCISCGEKIQTEGKKITERAPDYVLPFLVDQEKAVDRLESFTSGAYFVPRVYSDREFLKQAQPLYIPYWVYDVEQHGDVSLDAVLVFTEKNRRERCRSHCKISAKYPKVAFDASEMVQDDLSTMLTPYSTFKIKSFDPADLEDYITEPMNVEPEVYREDAKAAANERTFRNLNGRGAKGGTLYCRKPEYMNSEFHTEVKNTESALMPVWLLTWRKKNRVACTAVNGSTGKTVGDLPVDLMKFLLFCAAAAAVLFGLLYFLFGDANDSLSMMVGAVAVMTVMQVSQRALNELYQRESHAGDKGLLSHMGGKRPSALKRAGKLRVSPFAVQILYFCLLYIVRGLQRSPNETVAGIKWAFPYIVVIYVLMFLYHLIGREWLPLLRATKNPFQICMAVLMTACVFGTCVIFLIKPASYRVYYGMLAAQALLSIVLLGYILRRISFLGTRPVPKSVTRILLLAGILLFSPICSRMYEAAENETEAAQEFGVYVSDLTDTLSETELEQIRSAAQPLTQYASVYIVYIPDELGYREGFEEAFGKDYSDLSHENALLLSFSQYIVHRGRDTEAAFFNSNLTCGYGMSSKYWSLDDLRLEDYICEPRLDEGDYTGAVAELVPFLKAFLEMEYPVSRDAETDYAAVIADYGHFLSQEETAALLERATGLTKYSNVLISFGTPADMIDTSDMNVSDEVRQLLSDVSMDTFRYGFFYSYRSAGIKLLHIYVNGDDFGVREQTGSSYASGYDYVLRYYRSQPESPYEEFREKAEQAAKQKNCAECAGNVLDYVTQALTTFLPETDPQTHSVPPQIEVPDTGILDLSGSFDREDEESLIKAMEQLAPWGKTAIVKLSAVPQSDEKLREFLENDLRYFSIRSNHSLVLLVGSGSCRIERDGKFKKGLSEEDAKELEKEFEMGFGKSSSVRENVETLIGKISGKMEAYQKLRAEKQPLQILICAMTAVVLSAAAGLWLTFRGRFDQKSDPDDPVCEGTATIEDEWLA